jgi:hypothetical protein
MHPHAKQNHQFSAAHTATPNDRSAAQIGGSARAYLAVMHFQRLLCTRPVLRAELAVRVR